MDLLLLSNSRSDRGYLVDALPLLRDFIADLGLAGKAGVMVPFARIATSWDEAVAATNAVLEPMGVSLTGLHQASDPIAAVEQAPLIVVCGGNTFSLLKHVNDLGLLPVLRRRVTEGAAYIGWSAGANLTCPSIATTNDMPIVDPGGHGALELLPFQINPHYTNAHPPGHHGETRNDRIAEFCTVNPTRPVLALPEGTSLRMKGDAIELFGDGTLLFRSGAEPAPVEPGQLAPFWSDSA
jgi:dipeptidase E